MAHHPGLTVTFGIPEGAVKVAAPKAKPIAPLMSAREALRDALRLMLRNDLVLGVKDPAATRPVIAFPPTIENAPWIICRAPEGDSPGRILATCETACIASAIVDALNNQPELIP